VEIGLLLALPAGVALFVASEPILAALFQRGALGPEESRMAALALSAYAVGLPGTILIKALSTGFFARQDTMTPLRIAILVMLANAAASIILVYSLPVEIGHAGIALATGIAGWLNSGLLALVLIRRGLWRPDQQLWRRVPRLVAAAVGMGLVLWGLQTALAPLWQEGEALRLLGLILLVSAGALAYGVLVLVFRGAAVSDLRRLKRP